MLSIPETFRTPRGLTVEGASPALLKDLLEAYKYEIERRDPHAWDGFRPGHSRQQILDRFSAEELHCPEELVVWWEWSDGHPMMYPRGLRNVPIGLDRTLSLYREDRDGMFELLPGPEWVRILGQGRRASTAVFCGQGQDLPLVAFLDVEEGLGPGRLPDHCALSLCTPVTWLLTSLAEGWVAFNESRQRWSLAYDEVPLEWRLTQLL